MKAPTNSWREEKFSWNFNDIRIKHIVSRFDGYDCFSAHNNSESVRLHFGLRGDYSFGYRQLDKAFDLAGGHHNIMYSKGLDLDVKNKTLEIETFGIDFPTTLFLQFIEGNDDFLKDFATAVLEGKNNILSKHWGTINVSIQNVIDDIVANSYTGELKNIFLMAKSLELLVLCIDNYRHLAHLPSFFLKNKTDKERIVAARDLINDRVSSPPHLSEIAKTVGINEYKLKNGFKEMFQTTVFGYLTSRRLNLARQLLLDTQKTAAEIAFELGYSSPQHFTMQFRKFYGVTPKSIRNNP